jgi:DnaK suppressor protein
MAKKQEKKTSLKATEIEELRLQLIEMRAEVLGRLKGSADSVKDHAQGKAYSQHQADAGTDDFDREIMLGLNHQETDLLQRIERALEKIDEGTYGVCDYSGEVIPKARLQAMPYACLTVASQEILEKKRR